MDELRSKLKDKKRVVVKIGSSSLQHPETGDLDYIKDGYTGSLELCNIHQSGQGCYSGNIGKRCLWQKGCSYFKARFDCRETGIRAAIGQARLMTTYQRIFL